MWFIDKNSPYHWIYHRIKRHVASVVTQYQTVEILDTYECGRMVVLNGKIQSAESDEFIYHEILVHPAMITHPKPERILILGAGEGATLREVLRHPTVKKAVMVDIDGEFVSLCKRYLRKWHRGSLEDEKVDLVYDDAFAYLRRTTERFDVIIGDISDPDDKGPAHAIYTSEFYSLAEKALMPGGIFVTHAAAVYFVPHKNYSAGILKNIRRIFSNVDLFYEFIPSFGTLWSYASGSFRYSVKAVSPKKVEQRLKMRRIEDLSYYNSLTHKRLFIVPPCLGRNIPN